MNWCYHLACANIHRGKWQGMERKMKRWFGRWGRESEEKKGWGRLYSSLQLVKNYSQTYQSISVSLKRIKYRLINQEIQWGTAVGWESEETSAFQLTTASLLSIDARLKSGSILSGNGAKMLETIQCSTNCYFNFVPQSMFSVEGAQMTRERKLLWSFLARRPTHFMLRCITGKWWHFFL